MKIRNMFSNSCCLLCAGFLLLSTGLTGCAGRQAEFLAQESHEEDEDTASLSSLERSGDGQGETDKDQLSGEPSKDEAGNKLKPDDAAEQQEKTEIYVDVCGAVVKPGVYVLEPGSRVFQAIEAAGGYLPAAAQGYVNRAQGLDDGQQVYIPTQEEAESGTMSEGSPLKSADGTASSEAQPGESADGRVNLNTADETQLTTLPGIGASKAQAIIAYREENGPFSAIEDIMNVQGIKEGTFTKIKDDIAVE